MDALYSRFSLRGRATLDVITYFLFALYLVILIWYGGAAGWHSFFIDERSDTVFGPPMWPTKLAVFFGAIFLFIAGTTKFIRDLTTLVLGKKVD
jgi:TRAP-type mannitol/chloroaromatic compound transport system permease small subunit